MSASTFEMEDVVNNLRSSASVGAFESSDLTTYRATLRHALFQVVIESSDWNHQGTSFDHILYTGIPWMELLEYQSRRRSLSTPLEELLDVLLNPCIVPYAMSSSIVITFLRVLVEDSMSVSHHHLLKVLRRLLETRPSIQVDKWIPYIQANLCLSVDTVETYNVDRAHRLVSICKYLPSLAILKCLLTLLQSIDDVDVKLLQTNRIKQRKDSCLCHKRKRRISNMRILDDDNVQDGSGLMVQTVNIMGGGMVERISRVGHNRHAEQCDVCRLPQSARGITQLGIHLVVLRSRIYRKVVSIFNALADKDLNRQRSSLLQSVVHFACLHPETASLRLCVLLLADSTLGCQCAIEYLWTMYQQRVVSFGETVLKVYAELLVECSHFDKPIKCWEALQPLVNHVTKLCDSQLSSSVAQTSGGGSDTPIRHVLQCLSFILCRRRPVLAAIETDPKWKGLTSKLSVAFSDANWWISNDMSQNEKEETLCTLQAVGILGFLDAFDDSNDEESQQCSWPFPEFMGIRSAHRRMGPSIAREGLLSNPSFRVGGASAIAAHPHKESLSRRSEPDDRIVGTPIMAFLNHDVLQIVFSFLGYKRLVKASVICKAWRMHTQDDTLWCQAYASRFPILNQDKSIAASVTRGDSKFGSWKRLLVNKVLAEKALRFKRHSSGWKHRTCAHIGCLMVLRSPSQMIKHYGTHAVRTPKDRGSKLTGAKRKLPAQKVAIRQSSTQRHHLKEDATPILS